MREEKKEKQKAKSLRCTRENGDREELKERNKILRGWMRIAHKERERLQRGGRGEKLGGGVMEASGVSLRFVSFMMPLCVRTHGLTLAARWLSQSCMFGFHPPRIV